MSELNDGYLSLTVSEGFLGFRSLTHPSDPYRTDSRRFVSFAFREMAGSDSGCGTPGRFRYSPGNAGALGTSSKHVRVPAPASDAAVNIRSPLPAILAVLTAEQGILPTRSPVLDGRMSGKWPCCWPRHQRPSRGGWSKPQYANSAERFAPMLQWSRPNFPRATPRILVYSAQLQRHANPPCHREPVHCEPIPCPTRLLRIRGTPSSPPCSLHCALLVINFPRNIRSALCVSQPSKESPEPPSSTKSPADGADVPPSYHQDAL
ncbi:hypothetical protein HPB51_005943 [Rhipicephalus microplus]|uniref:Uncharacterized protein n=1 Tax=Rhipicephalus microplus TaxID=6941 RepID=A0A9J6EFX0_RHIMP|nr:hypothetical protein HPB51_005943 [Rhipicephalus microplus]